MQVVTTCLNDSAVVNSIVEDAGPALDVSHNYQSELFVFRGAKPWLHYRLTKSLCGPPRYQTVRHGAGMDAFADCFLSAPAGAIPLFYAFGHSGF